MYLLRIFESQLKLSLTLSNSSGANNMKIEDIQLILDHFEQPIFPRTISTKVTQGKQIPVYNIEEIYSIFEQANFIDCRINAYPDYTNYQGLNRQAPNFVMCDLDITKFRTEKLLLRTLNKTTENIAKDSRLYSKSNCIIYRRWIPCLSTYTITNIRK